MTAIPLILIVEDCEDAVPALQIALESYFGCEVRHSTDAGQALAALDAGEPPPLALITDLNMPGASGFDLIRSLRANRLWDQTPIIVISAETFPGTPSRVTALGADAFFPKPFSPGAVCQSLERILHAKNQSVHSGHLPGPVNGAERDGPERRDSSEARPPGKTE